MLKSDFNDHNIKNFTAAEVEATGASLGDVQLRLMLSLQAFRILIDRRVGLIPNGMTTGKHQARQHPLGLAVDGFLYPDDGPVTVTDIVKEAIIAGFHGIGIYWNGKQFSFHFDLRPDYSFWRGVKAHSDFKNWTYGSLFWSP